MDLVCSGIHGGIPWQGIHGWLQELGVGNLLQGDAPVPGKEGALSRGRVRLELVEFLVFPS